jgi:hypothetical protein
MLILKGAAAADTSAVGMPDGFNHEEDIADALTALLPHLKHPPS